jgi:hypothetical protein
MRKAEVKKPKGKRDNNKAGSLLEKEFVRLTEELVEVAEEMELASGESSTLEDIEGAKALASDVLEKYSALLNRLDPRKKIQFEESVGPVIEQIKHGLTLLKEAPE